jgi:glycosyltransferase involved in cell wall biosynthesis
MSIHLSVVILTFNEEVNLPRCLESLRPLPCDLFIVDSGSTDATLAIARQHHAYIAEHPFQTHALQWGWALQNLPLRTDWVLAIDADQSLTPELARELAGLFGDPARLPVELGGLYLNRRQIFRGRWIRYGGYYPKYLLKLFRRDAVRVDANDLVDHHFYVSGKTGKLRHDLLEVNRKEDDITFWISKHNRYAALIAEEECRRRNGATSPLQPAFFGSPDERILRLKQVWRALPLFLRPGLYFLYRYFFRLGFLDGKEGFIFHFLQGFWFRLLVDIKMDEQRAAQTPGAPLANTDTPTLNTGSRSTHA